MLPDARSHEGRGAVLSGTCGHSHLWASSGIQGTLFLSAHSSVKPLPSPSRTAQVLCFGELPSAASMTQWLLSRHSVTLGKSQPPGMSLSLWSGPRSGVSVLVCSDCHPRPHPLATLSSQRPRHLPASLTQSLWLTNSSPGPGRASSKST